FIGFVLSLILPIARASTPGSDGVVLAVFAVGGLVMVSSGFKLGLHLYLAPDLELLLAAPVPLGSLFWGYMAKAASFAPVSLASALGVAALYGYSRSGPAAAALALPAVAALGLMTLLTGALISMLLTRLVPPRRLHMAISLLPLGSVVMTMVAFRSVSMGRPRAGAGLSDSAERLGRALMWFPTSWPVTFAFGPLDREWTMVAMSGLLLAAAIAALGLATTTVFRSTFATSWGHIQDAPVRAIRRTRAEAWTRTLPPQVRAIVLKDWRTYVRNPSAFAQFLMPLVLFAFLFASAMRVRHHGLSSLPNLAFLVAVLGGIGSQSFSFESRNFALLKGCPLRGRDILAGKFVAHGLLAAAPAALAALAVAVRRGWGFTGAVGAAALGLWLVLGSTLINVSASALGVDFRDETPRMKWWTLLANTLASMTFGAAHIALVAWVVASLGSSSTHLLRHPAVGVIAAVGVVVSWVAVWLLFLVAGRRFERIDAP
ncbi:MAG TPA: hypothetical protein VNE62_13170, partial [Actinomycetota bacterium]|nr:hypothetical protein [Actinomycetota bacterium]